MTLIDQFSTLQSISSVFSGIILGISAFNLQWLSRNNFLAEIIPQSNVETANPKFISIRQGRGMIKGISVGILFCVLGYVGAGRLFGFNFTENIFSNVSSDFTQRSLLILFGLGFMSNLYLSLIGGLTDKIIRTQFIFKYFIVGCIAILGIVSATIISAVFFDKNPFLFITISTRILCGFIFNLFEPSEYIWKAMRVIVVVCVVVILPIIAFVSGNRFA